MAAFIVVSWWAFAKAQDRPAWGAAAGVAAIAGLLHQGGGGVLRRRARARRRCIAVACDRHRGGDRRSRRRTAGRWRASPSAGLVALALFVGPHWSEYRFYNWQMSVTRKPSYDLASLLNRVTWFPILHDIFTRCGWWSRSALAAFVARALGWCAAPAGRAAARAVGRRRRPRAAAARRRQRAPVRLPDPGARRARRARPRGRSRDRCRPGSAPLRALAARSLRCAARALRRLRRRGIARSGWRSSTRCGRPSALGAALAVAAHGGGLGLPAAACGAVARRPWTRRPRAASSSPSSSLGGIVPVRAVGGGPDLQERRGLARARPAAAARHAGPRQARQRPGAREPHPADLRRPRASATTRTGCTRTMCASSDLRAPRTGYEGPVILDVLAAYPNTGSSGPSTWPRPRRATTARRSSTRARRPTAPAPARCSPVSTPASPVRRIDEPPSRRTPTCGSAPSTTTRCSSTTAAPRSSRSSSAPA